LQNEYLKNLSFNWDSQRIVFPKTGVKEEPLESFFLLGSNFYGKESKK